MQVLISHCADVQVKARNHKGLERATEGILKDIEKKIEQNNIDVHIISGDLFEYAVPTDIERTLIYNHISRLLNIDSLKELIIIAGNHDLVKSNSKQSIDNTSNAIDTVFELIKTLDTEKANKIRYYKESGVYDSSIHKYPYVVYSLEDSDNYNNESVWQRITDYANNINGYSISLYHAMLRDYVMYDGIPLQQDKLNKLKTLDDFAQRTIVLAGDIHKNLIFQNKKETSFVYPGSTQQHSAGEGKYIHIGLNVDEKQSESKVLMVYSVDSSNNKQPVNFLKPIEIDTKEANKYVTITFDNKLEWPVIKQQLIQLVKSNKLDVNNNIASIVRFKISNKFRENWNEIRSIIKDDSNYQSVTIEFADQVTSVNQSYSDNPVISKIIEEKNVDVQSNVHNNFDNLLLNNNQIQELFESALQTVIDSTRNELPKNIDSDVVNLFKSQLEKIDSQYIAQNDIKLELIKTDGFMYLGPLSINLSNTNGLTRIIGTNGVGKTTLYRLVYWTLTGTPFEWLPSNSKQRSLLVFNNKKPEIDTVKTIVHLTINDTLYSVVREAKRIWKNNTTRAQKLSENWQQYISSVTQNVAILFLDEEGQFMVLEEGAMAEKWLSNYFSSIIDTIMFIDHTKIKHILNLKPAQLNNLILDYIGISYLKILEQNLDSVKDDLMSVRKPTMDKESLFELITDTKIEIKQAIKKIETTDTEISNVKQFIENTESDIARINENLISMGDIHGQIHDLENLMNSIKNQITNFIIPIEQEKPEMPVKEQIDENVFTEINKKITDNKIILESLNKSLSSKQTDSDTFKNNRNAFLQNVIEICNQELSDIDNDINTNNNIGVEIANDLYSDYEKIIKTYELSIKEQETIRQPIIDRIKQIQNKIESLRHQLTTGICSECKRPFDNDFDSDSIKNKIKLLENALLTENTKLVDTDIVTESSKVIEKANRIMSDYSKNRNLEKFLNANLLNVSEPYLDRFSKFVSNFNELMAKRNRLLDVMKFIQVASVKQIHDESNLAIIDNEVVKKLIQSIIDTDKEIYKLKQNIIEINNQIESTNTTIDNAQKVLAVYNNKQKQIETNYEQALIDWQEKCKTVENNNKLIIEKQYELKQLKNKYEQTVEDHKKIIDEKLHKYNELRDNLQKLKNSNDEDKKKIDLLISQQTTLCLHKQSCEHKLEDLQKSLEEFDLYERNKILYTLYSKLIKKHFPEIVFEYYRVYLNNTLNDLLSDVSFKLYWNTESELIMISSKAGVITSAPVGSASGMETTFLGLSLLYTIHLLNLKNSISHIFVDEISGTLNNGNGLSYNAENYQELFTKILSKFVDKSIFIIDHNITDFKNEVKRLEVVPDDCQSLIISQ